MNDQSPIPADKERRLRQIIREAAEQEDSGRVIIGFSGGVDSSLLLWETVQVLGPADVTAVTATSPTSAPQEEHCAREFARALGVEHLVIPSGELDDPAFTNNSNNRCYVCKRNRYGMLKDLAKGSGGAVIFDGSQSDDDPADRPGMRAVTELHIMTPLAEAGIGKQDVRDLLQSAGYHELSEKSAQPCLATRIPSGTPITLEALEIIRRGELFLKECGLVFVRLRHHYPMARIVTDSAGISLVLGRHELRQRISKGLKLLGYEYVTLDLEEY